MIILKEGFPEMANNCIFRSPIFNNCSKILTEKNRYSCTITNCPRVLKFAEEPRGFAYAVETPTEIISN